MANTDQDLKRLLEKLQRLVKNHTALEKENQKLKQELETRNKEVADHIHKVDELKQQVSILKLNAREMNATDKKEFEKRINVYLKEIDRCIAMLGQ